MSNESVIHRWTGISKTYLYPSRRRTDDNPVKRLSVLISARARIQEKPNLLENEWSSHFTHSYTSEFYLERIHWFFDSKHSNENNKFSPHQRWKLSPVAVSFPTLSKSTNERVIFWQIFFQVTSLIHNQTESSVIPKENIIAEKQMPKIAAACLEDCGQAFSTIFMP